jgi:glycine dehydrogenase subunit 2
VHGFWGNFAVLVRAFAYVTIHGTDGLQTLSESAVLNANYLATLVDEAYPRAYPGRPMHEFVVTAKRFQRSGLHAMDLAKRMIDLGSHPPTVAFPLVVEEALMIEPTEAETKETLDGLAEALLQVAQEAETLPDLLHEAPVTTPVRRLDEARAARHLKLRWESRPD